MIGLWVAAALLAAGAGALMLHRAAHGRARAVDPSPVVYRRALAEIDELAARDLLAEDERRAVRAEAARRLLEASDRGEAPVTASGPIGPVLAAGAVAIAAAAIYLAVGSPGLPDQPFAARLAAWRAHPERYPPAALAAALGAIADERPGDLEPLQRLAALDLAIGDSGGAIHALRRAVAIAPQRGDLAAMLGEVTVLQAGGAVGPDARALFLRAVAADPGQGAARYYLARAKIADGDVAGGLTAWRALLASLPPRDARRAGLERDIAAVERSGTLPPLVPAPPPAADVSAAVRGMVEGLAARLRAHPDDPAGWVRLVRAYAVLGESGRRDAALATARSRYGGRPDMLAALAAAARAGPAG
ncbi:MAG TPA: c-type cytochrome biogenesis protein CcmI [Caulobacteraceae bacterium]|nr:c-type cytochrome biogenesis protein CcmI [Caulobacteraceae bacterium]